MPIYKEATDKQTVGESKHLRKQIKPAEWSHLSSDLTLFCAGFAPLEKQGDNDTSLLFLDPSANLTGAKSIV